MAMSRDLKLYFLLICLPAMVLTLLGLGVLYRQSKKVERQEVESRIIQVGNLADSIHSLVKDHGGKDEELRVALRGWTSDDVGRKPIGAFSWNPKGRLTWYEGMKNPESHAFPEEVRSHLAGLSHWNEMSAIGKKRKKRAECGWMEVGRFTILWGRGEGTAPAYGLVFDGSPLGDDGDTGIDGWFLGCVLVVLLACSLAAGTWLMARAAAKARRDDETKTTFLSNCSHELKTPLAGIGIWVDLLRNGRLQSDDRRQHAYEIIARENARMIRLVENLLDYSRLEQGRRRYHSVDLDLAMLTSDVVDLVREDFAEHGITVLTQETCHAKADSDAVKQILVNLLGNAAKYAAAEGAVEVEIATVNDRARVTVSDRGPGMSPSAMKHAFERFYRADDVLNSKAGGLGLGLSISQALARDMGGTLSVTARNGGGCIFTLELPVPGGVN